MARYSIDGQILTDMADAIRTKKGEVPIQSEMSGTGQTPGIEFIKDQAYKVIITPTSVSGVGGLGIYDQKSYKQYNLFDGADIYFTVGEPKELTFISPVTTTEGYFKSIKGLTISGPVTFELINADGSPFYSYTPEAMVDEVSTLFNGVDPAFTEMVTGASKGATITKLPESITNIKAYAFDGMSKLKLTALPDGLLRIGNYAFRDCSSLGLTSLPDSITTLDSGAFDGALVSLEALPENLTTIGDYTLELTGTLPSTLIIPAGVTKIGGRMFGYTTRKDVTEIIFLGTPTTLGTSYNGTFTSQTNITSIKVPWSEGAVANAPWGATNATITYNYVHEEA